MPLLTRQQVEKLAEIIDQHTTWFVWRTFGSQYVKKEDLDKLKAGGLLPVDVQASAIKNAYVLGRLEALLKEADFRKLTWAQLQEAAKGRFTSADRFIIEAAELSAYTKFRGLAADIRSNLYERLSQAQNSVVTEAQVRDTIKDIVKLGSELHRSFREVARDLVETLKEPTRNWTRVAATELHTAWQRGVVNTIIQKVDIYEDSEGIDSNVFVDHDDDACEDCKRIYNDPKTGHPRIMKLKDLLENEGSNYQRPWRQNAKPVVPPLHPHCYGRIVYVPPGWGFKDDGTFTLLDPKAAYAELYE